MSLSLCVHVSLSCTLTLTLALALYLYNHYMDGTGALAGIVVGSMLLLLVGAYFHMRGHAKGATAALAGKDAMARV